MSESDFNAVQLLLRTHNLVVVAARYDEGAFGSWAVTVGTTPLQRVVWDGKDGWLILEEETDEIFGDDRVWKDLWIAKTKSQQTPAFAVAAVLAHTGAA